MIDVRLLPFLAEEAGPEAGTGGGGEGVAGGAEVFVVSPAVHDHVVDHAPVGKAAEVAVVDIEVGLDLAGGPERVILHVVRLVRIDGMELETSRTAEVYRFLEQPPFACCPENQYVMLRLKLLEGINGEWYFLTDRGITVLNYGPVKIYCDNHFICVKFHVNLPIPGPGQDAPRPSQRR